MSKQTVEQLEDFITAVYEARSSSTYAGDYTITLTAEGRSLQLPLESIGTTLVSEDELLVHMNLLNIK